MKTGSILTTFFIFMINFNFILSSPNINVMNVQLKENDPFCIEKSNQQKNATFLSYIPSADYYYNNIPLTDKFQFNEELMFYIFDGLASMSVGIALGFIILGILKVFFEDEMRIHGIVRGIYETIQHEVLVMNEFAYKEAQRQLEYGYRNNNNFNKNKNNNNSYKRSKSSRAAAAYVTRANK